MSTLSLNYETTQFPQNTPTSQTLSGPLIPMVYYATKDESMFWIPTTYNYVFSNTHMIICLQDNYGQSKTLYQVHLNYYWPGLPTYVKNYCKSCTICSHAKPMCHRPYGLLKQLPIPERPWNSISMDFIENLPKSSGYTSILVMVDHPSKQSLFIPTYDMIMLQQLAQLFVLHVFSKHSVPSHVTLDHGSEFISHFFCSLRTALDMKLHFTSRYHPKGDGQTE